MTMNSPPFDERQTRAVVTGLLEQQTPVRFRVQGPSMNPVLRDGDVIEVHPVGPGDLRRGGVYLFQRPDRLTLHRLIARNARGDAGFVADAAVDGIEWISTEAILGVAVALHRNGRTRRLNTAFRRWAGRCRYMLRPVRRVAVTLRKRD
jgi:hypothetical protein